MAGLNVHLVCFEPRRLFDLRLTRGLTAFGSRLVSGLVGPEGDEFVFVGGEVE